MHRFVGIIGIIVILGICYLMSNNRKAISLKTVLSGLALQFFLAVFILTVPLGQKIINAVAKCIEKILHFANSGGDFVFGFLNNSPDKIDAIFYEGANFLFATKLIITIIFVLAIVNILYHFGIMQRVVQFFAKIMYKIMNVSGAEALSNIASAFYIDQYSGHKKNFSLFSKIITGEDKTFVQYRQTVPDLIKADLNLDNILLQKLIL